MEYSIVGPWMAMFVALVINALLTKVKFKKVSKGFGWSTFWLIAGVVIVLVDDSLACFIGAFVSFILMKECPRCSNGKVNPIWEVMLMFNFFALLISGIVASLHFGEWVALVFNWIVALVMMWMVIFHKD